MIMKIVDLSIAVIGTSSLHNSLLPFSCLSNLKGNEKSSDSRLSVIIPVRNEEKNIVNLLNDLKKQSLIPLEIIVVDDESSDRTYEVAKGFGVNVIKIDQKARRLAWQILGLPKRSGLCKRRTLTFFRC